MKKLLLALALALSACSAAFAQPVNNSNNWVTSGGQVVGGAVAMCVNPTTNLAAPCNASSGQAPVGATIVLGAFSGADTTSQAATLAANATKTTFICGFTVTGLGATALTNVIVAVASLTGATTLSYQYSMPAGATVVTTTPLNVRYQPCLPGNAINTAITVTVPGGAGNTSTAISAWGYQQ